MKKLRRFLAITCLLVSMAWIEVLAILAIAGHLATPEPAWIIWTPEALFALFVWCEFFWPRPRLPRKEKK